MFRLIHSGERIPIRLYLSNESGYSLDITMYKEVMDERVKQVPLVSTCREFLPVYLCVNLCMCIRLCVSQEKQTVLTGPCFPISAHLCMSLCFSVSLHTVLPTLPH